jgi:hypothetical protein
MTKEAIKVHFETPTQVLQDVERLMECMVNQYKSPC